MAQQADAAAGAAVYSRRMLWFYDWFVIGFSNRFVWRCPSHLILNFYNEHISANHLDVGVGTGYFLDKCAFPTEQPRLALLDLNPNSLRVTAKRLRRHQPTTHPGNVLEPIALDAPGFDSIGLGYLLHCLPGAMETKGVVFHNLKALINEGGVLFGTTILGAGTQPNALARGLLKLYNARGIFGNMEDSRELLEHSLQAQFDDYTLDVVGMVAFFTARI